MSWLQKIRSLFFNDPVVAPPEPEEEVQYEEVRARNAKGRYVADDPTTPENEAFVKRVKKKKRK